MDWLIAFPSAHGIDLIREGNIVAMYFVRVDANDGA
jgi:hypothetical protein